MSRIKREGDRIDITFREGLPDMDGDGEAILFQFIFALLLYFLLVSKVQVGVDLGRRVIKRSQKKFLRKRKERTFSPLQIEKFIVHRRKKWSSLLVKQRDEKKPITIIPSLKTEKFQPLADEILAAFNLPVENKEVKKL